VRLRAGGKGNKKGKGSKKGEEYYLGRAETVNLAGEWADVRWLYRPDELVAKMLPPELRPGARGGAGPLPRERLLTDHVDRQPLAAIEGPAEVSPAQELQDLEGDDGPFFWRHIWVGGRVRADPDGSVGEALLRGEDESAAARGDKRKASESPADSPSSLPPARKKRKGAGGLATRGDQGDNAAGQEFLERAEAEGWFSRDDASRLRELADRSHAALEPARMSLSPLPGSPAASLPGREEGTALLREALKAAATEAWESLSARRDAKARFAGEVIVEAAHGDAFLVSLRIHDANYRGWLARVPPARARARPARPRPRGA